MSEPSVLIRPRSLSGAILLLAALTGCGEESRTETEFTPSSEKSSRSADDIPPELMQVSDRAAGGSFHGAGTGVAMAQLTPV